MSVMPLYNIIALPGAKLWLQTSAYRELTGKEPVAGERVTLLMQKQEQPRAALDADSFRPIGVVGSVGDGKMLDYGTRAKFTVQEGDRVLFLSYAGEDFKFGDCEFLLMRESDILAIIN